MKEAQRLGYRSRAAFKLLELAERDQLFRPGIRVVDLGAAPGSWSQVLAQKLGPKATIVAVDLLAMAPVRGVTVLQGDFSDRRRAGRRRPSARRPPVDLVVSDMAPNLSGIDSVDQARGDPSGGARARNLPSTGCNPAAISPSKLSRAQGFDAFQRDVQGHFAKTYIRKPKASRDRSREVFIVGKGLRKVDGR